jgi:glutamine synthetase type III
MTATATVDLDHDPSDAPAIVWVRVHDGRADRNPALVDASGLGEVLTMFGTDRAFDIGSFITLPNNSRWPLVGVRETFDATGWTQDVSIGDWVREDSVHPTRCTALRDVSHRIKRALGTSKGAYGLVT